MQLTPKVKEILSWYESDNPGTKANIARILMEGRLGGTGRMVILPVDQGFEHGPARSFAPNPVAYDPHYLYQLAIESGVSGYAFVSSLSAYAGWPPGPLGPEDDEPTWTTDDDEYGPIKAFAERTIGAALGGRFLTARAGLIIGPLFVVAEAGFLLGLRRELQHDIEARVGPVREGSAARTA